MSSRLKHGMRVVIRLRGEFFDRRATLIRRSKSLPHLWVTHVDGLPEAEAEQAFFAGSFILATPDEQPAHLREIAYPNHAAHAAEEEESAP